MSVSRNAVSACVMAAVTLVLVGVGFPMVVTGVAQVLLPDRANGQLLYRDGRLIGSRLIGQPFSSPGYFHSRPSAAGAAGYDAAASGGSNLGPTNRTLVDAVRSRVAQAQGDRPDAAVPIDLVTASGSGLDPHISPAAAAFQVMRVARARGVSPAAVQALVQAGTKGRDLGFLGEARVNVLLLNLALDAAYPMGAAQSSPGTNR